MLELAAVLAERIRAGDNGGMTSPTKLRFQFGLVKLFWLMTLLASTAAIFAWLRPYFAVGVDPTLSALPLLAVTMSVFVLALIKLSS